MLWRCAWLLPVALLSGCSWLFGDDGLFPDNTERYQNAVELQEIRVPAGVGSPALSQIYPIPTVQAVAKLESEFDVPRPAPLTSGAQQDAVRIQRLGDESWALVAVSPGQLWPQVRAFLASSGIAVASSSAQAGLIDTQYVTLTDQPLPVRFRFRVESGVQRNTAELHVLQQNRTTEQAASWPQLSDNLELEQTMLRNVAQFIANSAEAAPISMMADQAMSASGRITLEETDVGARLQLQLPFNRAWASVNKALPESGFVVDDLNRSEGVFYVTFGGPDGKKSGGWFDWLWGGEDQHPLANNQYLVKLSEQGEGSVMITLTDGFGAPPPRRDQAALLTILKGNIN